jgi:hypothetical protein
MSILAAQKQRDPQAGFAGDFLDVLERLVPLLIAQPQLKIITNAGGINPTSCAQRARVIVERGGLKDCRIATVTGDDLLPRLDQLLAAGHPLTNLDTGAPLTSVRDRIVSANAYLGAGPIVSALQRGARIVVTGRVADASLTVAPAVHEHGWAWEDVDMLCAGTVAGHLIECGAQATGGLWCNWQDAPDLASVGYPIAEIESDGTVRITKPPDTGGTVNIETVSEQLLYEVGDPVAYLTPDVTADFTTVKLRQVGDNVVQIEKARGKPATSTYKVSIAYRDGFTSSGTLLVAGPEASCKAKRCGEMLLDRLRRVGLEFERSNIECLGAGAAVPGVITATADSPEVMLRVAVHDARRSAVERFTKEFAPLVTSGLPGVSGYTTGRPPVREVFAYWPALIDKNAVAGEVQEW